MSPTADEGRRLFAYLHGEEWASYRTILAVFAGTSFAELTPDDVAARLARDGVELDAAVVADRLERLRSWGNLTVSASVGNPTSVADYYRLRNRYLITRAGQEVHDLVERVLGGLDAVTDITPGRLRALLTALRALEDADVDRLSPEEVGDLVRAVFDPHAAFAAELAQFFAEINVWQSRYDLDEEQLAFFTGILVGYVGDRLDEVDRTSRPIAATLARLRPRLPAIAARVGGDLGSLVAAKGLELTVARAPGSSTEDWDHLLDWFLARDGVPARLDRLRREAVAAVRTLTANLTRLSRSGVGASSKRSDLLRLAGFFAAAGSDVEVAALGAAAFGLHPTVHLGVLPPDAADPLPTTTPWRDAPPADVPISIRERGDTTNRGRATPLADRTLQQRLLRERREHEAATRRAVDDELLALGTGPLDGASLSPAALARLQQLVGQAVPRLGVERAAQHAVEDGGLRCLVRRVEGQRTRLSTPAGQLTLDGLEVAVEPIEAAGALGALGAVGG